jgi:hypothetical protein
MREAYSPTTVLEWLDGNIPEYEEVSYFDEKGMRKPSKFGEALCFVSGAGPVVRPVTQYDDGQGLSLLHELVARVLVAVRGRLQKIKHADQGTPEEREQLLSLFTALEGALMLGLFFGHASAPWDLPAA